MPAALLLAAPGAIAAVDVGYPCLANDSEADWTVVAQSREGAAGPPEFPTDGVVTAWKIEVGDEVPPLEQRFGVYRPAGGDEMLTVGESGPEPVGPGSHTFSTRIAVKAGDRPGIHGSEETIFCDKLDGDSIAYYDGAAPVGTTHPYVTGNTSGMPVVVVLEPDADNDGYGDETQDGCPRSGLFVGDCPAPVRLKVKRKVVRKRWIQIRAVSTGEASVDVYGQVGWNFQPKREKHRKRMKHRRHARAHISKKKGVKRLIVGLDGGSKQVVPGVLTRFTIRLPKTVQRRLSRLTRRQSIRAKITLRATNPAGIVKNTRVRMKLRGRRKNR